MTLTLLIFDHEVTNLVISRQITTWLSLNLVHMRKYIKDGKFSCAGWIFVLAPAGASTPLVLIKIHTSSVNLIVIVQILFSILFLLLFLLLFFPHTFFCQFSNEIRKSTAPIFINLYDVIGHKLKHCACYYDIDLGNDLGPRSHEWCFTKMAISWILSKIFQFRLWILKANVWG